jgi:NAD(P)-dependent dehydrogenase (short-subunit alcohol dehydrogenase family)
MKIIVIGGEGTLGKAVVSAFGERHEVIVAGRGAGEQVDIRDRASVKALFRRVGAKGKIEAVAVAAGSIAFGPLLNLTREQFELGLNDKLMGQVNVALEAAEALEQGGSITLISGVLSDDPIRYGASASMVNAAVEGFVRAAALELPRGLRINVVSPTILAESVPAYGAYMPGYRPISAAQAALGYVKSVEGAQTGQVYRML